MRNRRFLFCSLCILLYVTGCSNYGKIEGVVLDKLNEKPIAGATITIQGTTLSSLSDSDGKFKLKDVVPGVQRVIVSKEGYISLSGDTDLTVAKGTTTKSSNLFLISQPPHSGLFSVSGALSPIAKISEKNWNMSMNGNSILEAQKAPPIKAIDSNINMILYEGDNPNKALDISMYPMKFYPADRTQVGFFAIPSPDRWVTQEAITQGIKIEKMGKGLAQITGQVSPGRYCCRVKYQSGIEDWYFVFDTK